MLCALTSTLLRRCSSSSSSLTLFRKPFALRIFTASAMAPSQQQHQQPLSYPKDEDYLQKVIPERIRLFESIKAQQLAQLQSLPPDPIKISLPDGSVKEGKKWVSSPMNIAQEISKGLASNALISSVNGVLWDMNRPLEGDCELKIFTFDSDEGRDTFWHSSAHILGQVLGMLFCAYACALSFKCISPLPIFLLYCCSHLRVSTVASYALGPVPQGER